MTMRMMRMTRKRKMRTMDGEHNDNDDNNNTTIKRKQTAITPVVVVVLPPISKIKGEGKYWEDRLHRRPGGVAGYSKETLKKITKTHFGMTEVHAATARGHFLQR